MVTVFYQLPETFTKKNRHDFFVKLQKIFLCDFLEGLFFPKNRGRY